MYDPGVNVSGNETRPLNVPSIFIVSVPQVIGGARMYTFTSVPGANDTPDTARLVPVRASTTPPRPNGIGLARSDAPSPDYIGPLVIPASVVLGALGALFVCLACFVGRVRAHG